MAAPMQSCDESLETLTAMVHQTLIETGRFFRSGGSLQSRAQLKRNLPAVLEQYQLALDNLSEQIFIAKAFLEKDYEAIVARKAILRGSRPQGASSENQAQDVSIKDHDDQAPDAPLKPPSSPVQPTPATSQTSTTNAAIAPSDPTAQQGPAPATLPASNTTQSALSLPASESAPPPVPVEQKKLPNVPLGGGSQDISTVPEVESRPAESGRDLEGRFESILPGLESYANASIDEGVMEVPAAKGNHVKISPTKDGPGGTSHPSNPSTAQRLESGRTDVPMEDVGPAESTFDDLFVASADFAADEDDLLLQGTDIGDLDDSWFS
ncbi:hypothetical protein PRK78_007181 [Emydomyces testavorans]|uniref:Uncharacterized protein n=1 Tax=Emydomyces testavorans TaxID=2070801 RepID=A0AAF0DMT7_9EURO|nr:hypothetical protein PRK78_007181 [Emydomyces testavorans]